MLHNIGNYFLQRVQALTADVWVLSSEIRTNNLAQCFFCGVVHAVVVVYLLLQGSNCSLLVVAQKKIFLVQINLIKTCTGESNCGNLMYRPAGSVAEIEEGAYLLCHLFLRGLAFEVTARHGHVNTVPERHNHTARE